MNYNLKKRLKQLLTEKDNRQTLINKVGVSPEIADWAHNLSNKLSIWIANSLKKKYTEEMRNASEDDEMSLDEYYKTLDDDYKSIVRLLGKVNRPQINIKKLSFDEAMDLVGKYRYIEAWLDAPEVDIQAVRGEGFLKNVSWDDALAMAEEWHSSLEAGGEVEDLISDDDEIIHTFDNGFKWVLTKARFCLKSKKSMGHCAKASNPNMWLIRLIKGNSEYVTVDWDPEKKFSIQIKGKGNRKPIEKLHPYIVWLIQNKSWGGIDKLKTDTGYLPHTNFHLGDLKPELAAKIYGDNPDIMKVDTILKFTSNDKKSKLISNLFKYDSFVKKLVPYGFSKFFEMVDNKDSVSSIILKNPNFLNKMNKYKGVLTYTLEEMINASKYKDKLIEALLNKEGLINMLDEEGATLLMNNHSDPEKIEDIILQSEFDDELVDENVLYESNNIRVKIITELRKNLSNKI